MADAWRFKQASLCTSISVLKTEHSNVDVVSPNLIPLMSEAEMTAQASILESIGKSKWTKLQISRITLSHMKFRGSKELPQLPKSKAMIWKPNLADLIDMEAEPSHCIFRGDIPGPGCICAVASNAEPDLENNFKENMLPG